MATVQLKFGPADHGRPVTDDELDSAEYEPGFSYEVIDGGLYVSPMPNPGENDLEEWLASALRLFAASHPEVINYVTAKARVFVPGRPRLTVPEPDVAAYHDFPIDRPRRQRRWVDVSPLVVVEVLVDSEPDKDLVRNVELYLQVPSIAEYWVLDGRDDPDRPTLVVRRRSRGKWVVREWAFGKTYTTAILPGFELRIDPDQR